MNEIKHKEIDFLLKKLGQSEKAEARELSSPHLDADELSAFAENSLPEKARAFYASHLVECDECRKVVTNLNAAAGVLIEKKATSTESASLLSRIFSFTFPWINLRFALPSLAAVALLVISIVLIRQNQRPTFVTQVTSEPSRTEETPSIVSNSAPDAPAAAGDDRSRSGSKQKTDKAAPAESSSNGPISDRADNAAGEETRPADKLENKQLAEAEPKPASKITQPEATPPPTSTDEVSKKSEDAPTARSLPVAGRSVSSLEDQKAASNQPKKAQAAPAASASSRQEAEGSGATGHFAINPLRRAANEKEKNKDSDAETRTVVGHRFRKSGKVWTDVRYQSGGSTIDVVRGSEQFRALIADEPEIATVTSQLSGEVIIVWKGQAYHIKG